LPDYSLQLSPAQVLALTSASLKKNSRDLFMMKQDGYLPFTQAHDDLFIIGTNYTTTLLKLGLRSGLGQYSQDIRNCASYRGVSGDMYADCGNLYSAARELVNVSSDVLTWLQSDFQREALSRAWAVNYWLLAWVTFGLLLLSGCILPYLYRSKRHVMRMISLGRLVTNESAADIS
jgi:hypothetical protein